MNVEHSVPLPWVFKNRQELLLGHLSDTLSQTDDGCSQDRFKSEMKLKFNKVSLFGLKRLPLSAHPRLFLVGQCFPRQAGLVPQNL